MAKASVGVLQLMVFVVCAALSCVLCAPWHTSWRDGVTAQLAYLLHSLSCQRLVCLMIVHSFLGHPLATQQQMGRCASHPARQHRVAHTVVALTLISASHVCFLKLPGDGRPSWLTACYVWGALLTHVCTCMCALRGMVCEWAQTHCLVPAACWHPSSTMMAAAAAMACHPRFSVMLTIHKLASFADGPNAPTRETPHPRLARQGGIAPVDPVV